MACPLTVTSGIDELRELIGKPIGPDRLGRGHPGDIDKFAEISRDDQWIHVDVERAERESPFGTTVAHGNLTLSLIDGFRGQLIKPAGREARASTTAGTRSASPRRCPSGSQGPRDGRGAVASTSSATAGGTSSPSSRSSARAARSPSASPSRSAARWLAE